jgi:hypothetical protein
MNILKIQTEVLKSMVKEKDWIWSKGENNTVGLGNGYIQIFIPEDKVFLKLDKDSFNIEKFLKSFHQDDYKLASKAWLKEKDGRRCWKLKAEENGKFTWVDEQYTKYFDKDARYYVLNPRSAVFVVEGEWDLVGLIMPVTGTEWGF